MQTIEYNGYAIVHDGVYGMKQIKGLGRGAIPEALKGQFSTTREAIKAIDRSGTKKVTNDAEANSPN